jgi:hypothetical protein
MMSDYAPRFWFYGPPHIVCDEITHVLSVEDAPCHCGTWGWTAADQYIYARSSGWWPPWRRWIGALLPLLLLATPAWALPITDPAPAACAARGGSWWAFDVGGTCLTPRSSLTPREDITPRETVTPRPDPPLVLPPSGGGALVGAADPLPLQPTPEPGTLALVGTTLAGAGLWWRMRRGK